MFALSAPFSYAVVGNKDGQGTMVKLTCDQNAVVSYLREVMKFSLSLSFSHMHWLET